MPTNENPYLHVAGSCIYLVDHRTGRNGVSYYFLTYLITLKATTLLSSLLVSGFEPLLPFKSGTASSSGSSFTLKFHTSLQCLPAPSEFQPRHRKHPYYVKLSLN